MYGLDDVGRYFNQVTPEGEAAYAKQKAQEAAQAKPPTPDPTTALITIEQIKAAAKAKETAVKAAKVQSDAKQAAVKMAVEDDLARDKLAQEREIAAAKLLADTNIALNQAAIKQEQSASRAAPGDGSPKASLGQEPSPTNTAAMPMGSLGLGSPDAGAGAI